jgi:hypothetical protein
MHDFLNASTITFSDHGALTHPKAPEMIDTKQMLEKAAELSIGMQAAASQSRIFEILTLSIIASKLASINSLTTRAMRNQALSSLMCWFPSSQKKGSV